jgi:hypothetical protein
MNTEEMKGFGDHVARIAQATRLDKLAKSIAKALKTDCGCDKRREILNKMFPYKTEEAKRS